MGGGEPDLSLISSAILTVVECFCLCVVCVCVCVLGGGKEKEGRHLEIMPQM